MFAVIGYRPLKVVTVVQLRMYGAYDRIGLKNWNKLRKCYMTPIFIKGLTKYMYMSKTYHSLRCIAEQSFIISKDYHTGCFSCRVTEIVQKTRPCNMQIFLIVKIESFQLIFFFQNIERPRVFPSFTV